MMCTVAFELSNFFANCQTLLAGNLSRSTLPSVMVLDMKSSSCKKNLKMSQCHIFAVSGGYFVRLTCACTALYHSLMHSYFLDENWSRDQTPGSHLTGLWFTKISKPLPNCVKIHFHLWIVPRIHVLIHSKVAGPSDNFLALLAFREGCEFTL